VIPPAPSEPEIVALLPEQPPEPLGEITAAAQPRRDVSLGYVLIASVLFSCTLIATFFLRG
jgi:hypothetical protein